MSTVAINPIWFEAPQFPVRRFSVDEYHRMGEVGLLSEDDRVELIEGLVVPKMNRSPLHDVYLSLLQKRLAASLPPSWEVRVQMAITTGDSEPEPDIAVVLAPLTRYLDHHPYPAEIALVVEVSETSLVRDRRKSRMYARAGIPQYWIVNLRDCCFEVHTRPQPALAEPAFEQIVALGEADVVTLSLPGEPEITLAAREFLP